MIIQLKKGRDAASTLACIRADGSRTWGKLHPFFPLHDLTHCATESVLEFREGFFGLVASGWNIDDFAVKGATKRLPLQAGWAESIVGILDQERGMGRVLSASEFNEALAESLRGQEVAAFRELKEEELTRIRALRGRLFEQWRVLPAGETLEVEFPVASQALPSAT
ncbi:MAG: hypothetical protein L0170_18255 [Acidobacteria bacterium]|nr:hypothetical protein [Acidobacteriota bacterium]